ncbi:uncharacterized protein K441DRAFT_311899, partial [Cenococcum geophilum 1.58]|uniref:uncharacterized protein n=1 Tax=Cenococcum geophilum 1.58 TaxID=794803 RepID=UPI000DC94AAE
DLGGRRVYTQGTPDLVLIEVRGNDRDLSEDHTHHMCQSKRMEMYTWANGASPGNFIVPPNRNSGAIAFPNLDAGIRIESLGTGRIFPLPSYLCLSIGALLVVSDGSFPKLSFHRLCEILLGLLPRLCNFQMLLRVAWVVEYCNRTRPPESGIHLSEGASISVRSSSLPSSMPSSVPFSCPSLSSLPFSCSSHSILPSSPSSSSPSLLSYTTCRGGRAWLLSNTSCWELLAGGGGGGGCVPNDGPNGSPC